MEGIPDLIGMELNEGLKYLEKQGYMYFVVENSFPGKKYPPHLKKRIVRQRLLKTGKVEITFSFDTYSSGER